MKRLSIKDFELVRLETPNKFAPWSKELPSGTWTLQLDGIVMFKLGSLIGPVFADHSEVPWLTERQVAESLFEEILNVHDRAIQIGHKDGKEGLQKDFLTLMGFDQ